MGTITLTLPVAGTNIAAGLHATNYSTLQAVINGNLDNTNIAAAAAIAYRKLGIRPAIAYIRSAGQSIANATQTTLQVHSQEAIQDPNGIFTISAGVITVNETGWYAISGYSSWQSNGTGSRLTILVVTGGEIARNYTTASWNSSNVAAVQRLVSGSTVKMDVYQDAGGALTCTAGRLALVQVSL